MKNKINFKLVNACLILAFVCLAYLIKDLWIGIVGKILAIIFPFLIGFAIAYALHPLCRKLQSIGVNKWLSIIVVLLITFGLVISLVILVVPMLYSQIVLFLGNISIFISDISTKYSVDLGSLQSYISNISSELMKNLGTYVSNGAINIVNTSISFVADLVVVVFAAVYMLIYMDKIREFIKSNLKRKKKKTYNYIKRLDKETTSYFTGMGMNMLIQLIEYTLLFFLIGHPNYLILGLLAAVTNIIPYFGALIVNILALLIASVISTKLFILTLIVCLVCPQIDGYVIGPKVYGKTNKLNPLINIFAVFAGGILGGFWGVVMSIPITIILIATYKYFKSDIDNKIEKIKEKA